MVWAFITFFKFSYKCLSFEQYVIVIIMTELIQTEINHVQKLKLLLGVYVRELRETLQMDVMQLERLSPQVENLLLLHQLFLNCLKQRRIDCLEPGSTQNYYIHSIGDILIAQVFVLYIYMLIGRAYIPSIPDASKDLRLNC